MQATDTLFITVAKELAASFECRTRDGGKHFYALKDDAPAWVEASDVCMDAHQALGSRLPCDWVYEQIAAFAENLSGYDIEDSDDAGEQVFEIADGMVEVCDSELHQWMADSSYNRELVDEAIEDFGSSDECIVQKIKVGQLMGIERIGNSLIESIQAEVYDRELDEI